MSRKSRAKHKKAVKLVAYSFPKLPVTEQYRFICYNILFSSVDREIKSIVVTSPEPSDGKSTTAANLAIVLAQQGKATLLVDTDLRKPSIHYTFNISNMNGLTNAITRAIYLDTAIVKTFIPNLDILPSGPIPPNPSELLNSKSMATIMDDLKSKYEYVIFDAPPVLAVSDPQIMAAKSDGVVMVVNSGKTRKDSALKAKKILENVKGNILGVVLNGEKTSENMYYYQ
nr:CpsD/CapB family tyrosine-protein kinase [Bacillus massiliigorillae]